MITPNFCWCARIYDAGVVEPSSTLPVLAYVYHPRSFATLSLVEASGGRCKILWVVDTTEPETKSMVQLLRRFGACVDVAGLDIDAAATAVAAHRPDAVLTLADDCLMFTAELAQRLDLVFSSPTVARRYTDKYEQRGALARGGLVVPRHWVIDPRDTSVFEEIAQLVDFPAVLKPRRGQGSRDTFPVASYEELIDIWASEGYSSSSRIFVLEEFIPDSDDSPGGEGFAGYVSVESVVSRGEICHLAINGRMPPAHPFRETGFFIPAALHDDLAREVLITATQAARTLGVETGCLHTEIKLTPTGPVVIEVNGRIGGGVPEMLKAATGVDLLGIAFDLALGHEVTLSTPSTHCVSYLFYVQPPSHLHHIDAVDGLNELRSTPGVAEVVLNRGPGRDVDWRYGNHGHVFSVFGTCADHDELRRVSELIPELVQIRGS